MLQSDLFLSNYNIHLDAIRRFTGCLPEIDILNPSTSPASDSPTPFSPDGTTASFSTSTESSSTAKGGLQAWRKLLLPRTYGLVAYIHLYGSVLRGVDTAECIPGCYLERLKTAKIALQDVRDLATSGVDFKQQLMMQGVNIRAGYYRVLL